MKAVFDAWQTACGHMPPSPPAATETPTNPQWCHPATLPPWCHTETWNSKLESVGLADLDAESGWAHWCGWLCWWNVVRCGHKVFILVIAGCICVCVCGQCLCVLKAGLVFVQPCDLMIKMSLRGRLWAKQPVRSSHRISYTRVKKTPISPLCFIAGY